MSTAARLWRAHASVVILAVAAALLSGCGGDGGATAPDTSADSMPAPAAAQTFDPCRALTPQILAEHQWDARRPQPKQDGMGEINWRGCLYVAKPGYGFVVQTTNGTLAHVKSKFPAATETAVSGRRALRYVSQPDVPGRCELSIDMRRGSLYIYADVPQTPSKKNLVPCELATEIAEVVTPLLPAGS